MSHRRADGILYLCGVKVKDAKRLAHDWILENLAALPGFEAAFYHGSINWLHDNDPFPTASDLDIIVVTGHRQPDLPNHHHQPDIRTGKFQVGPLVLEVSPMPIDAFRTAEQILGTFYLAGSFKNPGIIADRSGHLTRLQHQVAQEYAAPYWVRRRCGDAQEKSQQYLDHSDGRPSREDQPGRDSPGPTGEQTDQPGLPPLHDQVTSWLFARGLMAHMLLIAGLKNPTVRKRYVEVKQLLSAHHSLEFYERLLQMTRFAHLTPAGVESHVATLAEVFDTAAAVIRTPYRYASDISKTARPLTIDGSYELIHAGHHREAMFWIVATHCRCQHILSQDAPPDIQHLYSEKFRQLLHELGIASFEDRQKSNGEARAFLSEVREKAERIIQGRRS